MFLETKSLQIVQDVPCVLQDPANVFLNAIIINGLTKMELV